MSLQTYTIDQIEAERKAIYRTVEAISLRLHVDEMTLRAINGPVGDADFSEMLRNLSSSIGAADSWLRRFGPPVP